MPQAPICVIGAGSSGITAAKALKDRGLAFDCFELGSGIGGNWRFQNDNGMSSAYASLHINTSKTRMAYSDFPMPEDYPDYPHHSQILSYFEDYVDHFDLRRHIQFNTPVSQVRPGDEGDWQVTLGSGETRTYRAVLVANGHHWDPKRPTFPGRFDGVEMHSHDYETPKGLEGKRVLVVGIGNSGVDIACEVSRIAARTLLSTRRSAHILPKYAFGRPIDTYTSPMGSRLPMAVQQLGFSMLAKIVRGPQDKVGVPLPKHKLMQAHPTISSDLLNLVGHGRIQVKGNVERLEGNRVRFEDGSEEEVDVAIYATGYNIRFPFFDEGLLAIRENQVRLYRHVVHLDHPGLFFVGLIQPLGAIMPLAEVQGRWVAGLLAGESSLPERQEMERVIDQDLAAMRRRYVASPRHTIQVDFFPYLATIQREMQRGRRRVG